MTNIDRKILLNTIKEKSPCAITDEQATRLCDSIIESGSDTFKPNLTEWMNDKPFSDITVHGYNINKVLNLWIIKDAALAILDLSNLEKVGPAYESIIIRRGRILYD